MFVLPSFFLFSIAYTGDLLLHSSGVYPCFDLSSVFLHTACLHNSFLLFCGDAPFSDPPALGPPSPDLPSSPPPPYLSVYPNNSNDDSSREDISPVLSAGPSGPITGQSSPGRRSMLSGSSHCYIIWDGSSPPLVVRDLRPDPSLPSDIIDFNRRCFRETYGRSLILRRSVPFWEESYVLGSPHISESDYRYLYYYVYSLPDPYRRPLHISYPEIHSSGWDYVNPSPTSAYPLPVPHGPPPTGFPLDYYPLEVFRPTYDVT